MKNKAWIIFAFAMTFALGYALSQAVDAKTADAPKVGRVTGIGGVFFKCQDPGKVKEWYNAHLGFSTDKYGVNFEWWENPDSSKKGSTQWGPFKETTKYFEPSTKQFMINYRVDDLASLVNQLRKDSVTIVDTLETYDYGKFIHIMDIEGNKIELWEAIDN
ncbi:MAG: VOC family protein [Candidatus Zixiibacteriota bacterium]